MHHIFYIDYHKVRNEFIEVAIEEHLGSIKARNTSNYLPHQVEHTQPIDKLPEKYTVIDPVS